VCSVRVKFYSLGDNLVRRPTVVRPGIALEVWNGDAWVPYRRRESVVRHREPLTKAQAVAVLHEVRYRVGLAELSDREARSALQSPGKRA